MKTPHGDLDRWPGPVGANARRRVLAQDLKVEGDATSSGPVDVHGKIIGSIRSPDIVIDGSVRVEGSAVANDLSVLGAVSGMISARNVNSRQAPLCMLVHADISHERIAVAAGGELEGRLQSRA